MAGAMSRDFNAAGNPLRPIAVSASPQPMPEPIGNIDGSHVPSRPNIPNVSDVTKLIERTPKSAGLVASELDLMSAFLQADVKASNSASASTSAAPAAASADPMVAQIMQQQKQLQQTINSLQQQQQQTIPTAANIGGNPATPDLSHVGIDDTAKQALDTYMQYANKPMVQQLQQMQQQLQRYMQTQQQMTQREQLDSSVKKAMQSAGLPESAFSYVDRIARDKGLAANDAVAEAKRDLHRILGDVRKATAERVKKQGGIPMDLPGTGALGSLPNQVEVKSPTELGTLLKAAFKHAGRM